MIGSIHRLKRSGLTAFLLAALSLVGVPKASWAAPAAATEQPAAAKVDINTATDKELEELPGVGPSTAKKIIANRPYAKVEDLSKAGLSEAKIAKLESLVTLGEGKSSKVVSVGGAKTGGAEKGAAEKPMAEKAAKIDINTATPKELEELPVSGRPPRAAITQPVTISTAPATVVAVTASR